MTTPIEDIVLFSKYPSEKLMKKDYSGPSNEGQYIYDQSDINDDIPVVDIPRRPMIQTPMRRSMGVGCGCCGQCKCSGACMGMMQMAKPTCVDIFEHLSKCPVCSKMYYVDKTPYYIIIIVLVVLCIILLKQVLEK